MPWGTSLQSAPDLYSVAIDPYDHEHLLVGFHSGWLAQDGSGDDVAAGVGESLDGGATWQLKLPDPAIGANHNVLFLDDSDSWLVLGEIGDGTYRTVDAGASWVRVNQSALRTGGGQLSRATDGSYYHSGGFGIFRSTEGGESWTNVIEGQGPSTQGITGDGKRIYASDGAVIVGQLHGEPFTPFLSAPEVSGDTGWEVTGSQLFDNDANHMAADRKNHFVYASAWRVGLLRMYAP